MTEEARSGLSPEEAAIDQQLEVLVLLEPMDLSVLYDNWQEEKIKVVSTALDIIHRAQKKIMRELK